MDQKNYDCLKLNNQLCFPLYACARETIKLYTPLLDKVGLTYVSCSPYRVPIARLAAAQAAIKNSPKKVAKKTTKKTTKKTSKKK